MSADPFMQQPKVAVRGRIRGASSAPRWTH
jgi:hypothetical protein